MRYILLLIPFLLCGCEKSLVYNQPTIPKLSGQWKLIDVSTTLQGVNSDSVVYILNDTVITEQYNVSSVNGNIVTFKQNWNTALPLDRFVINQTIWEFETNIIGLPSSNKDTPGYTYSEYYSFYQDQYSGEYNMIKTERGRNIGITTYGLNEIKLNYPNVWTMFKRNTSIEVFLKENVVLHFRRM